MEPERPFANTIDRLEDIVSLFLGMQVSPRFSTELRNSDEAIFALASLVVSHVQGVIELARMNPPLLPAAAGCARAAFETAANLSWIAGPDEYFEREGRWLGWYAADVRYWEQLSSGFREDFPLAAAAAGQIAAAKAKLVSDIARLIEDLTARQGVPLPKLEIRLESIGQDSAYWAYRELSQIVHAMPDATRWLVLDPATGLGASPALNHASLVTVLNVACWSLNSLPALARLGARPDRDAFLRSIRLFEESLCG